MMRLQTLSAFQSLVIRFSFALCLLVAAVAVPAAPTGVVSATQPIANSLSVTGPRDGFAG